MMLKLKLQYFGHLIEELTHWKRLWCWEGLGAGGEGDDGGWDGWMASLTRWTWVWVNSGSWWWTGRPGVLWFMGSQRVGHYWATELNWTEWIVGWMCGTWVNEMFQFKTKIFFFTILIFLIFILAFKIIFILLFSFKPHNLSFIVFAFSLLSSVT